MRCQFACDILSLWKHAKFYDYCSAKKAQFESNVIW